MDKKHESFKRKARLNNQYGKFVQLSLAVEFGYKGCEKGWNLERTQLEFNRVLRGEINATQKETQ